MERENWLDYVEKIEKDEKHALFNKRCNEMMEGFIKKYDFVKSMEITNKIEGDVISKEKIDTVQVLSDVQKGKTKASNGKKMIEWNDKLTEIFEKNPFVLDYIIL